MMRDPNQLIEQKALALVDMLRRDSQTTIAVLGYIALSVLFNWCRNVAIGLPLTIGQFGMGTVVSLGEIAGFFAFAMFLYARKRDPGGSCLNACIVCLYVLIMLGAMGLSAPPRTPLAIVCSLLVGIGYAGCLVMMLRGVSVLPARKMAIVIGCGFFSGFVFDPLVNELSHIAGLSMALTAAVIACVGTLVLASHVPPMDCRSYATPWQLVVFAAIIPLAFGFCSEQLGGSSLIFPLMLGYAIPSGIILISALIAYQKLTLVVIHWIAFPLAITGVASTLLIDMPNAWAKTLVSAGLASIYILIYMLVRIRSGESRSNPTPAYALLTGTIVLASNIGMQANHASVLHSWNTDIVAMTLVLMIVIVYGILVLQPSGSSRQTIYSTLRQDDNVDSPTRLARTYGLSSEKQQYSCLCLSAERQPRLPKSSASAPRRPERT